MNKESLSSGVTLRAVVIGLICVAFLSIATPYCDLVLRSTWIGSTYLPIGVIIIFLVIAVGVNALLKVLNLGLNQTELLLIYCMMLAGAGIPSFGLSILLIPLISAPFYFATPENKWVELFHKYLPSWLFPQDPTAIKYLFEKLPKGAAIPWAVWLTPLLFWTILVAGIYLVMFSLATLFRKQWVENEKLVFPLTYLPVEVSKEQDKLIPAFFKNRIMWLFFAIPAVIYTVKALHFYFPAIPDINLCIYLRDYLKEKPWDSLQFFWIRIWFSAIGLVYLIPSQLSFSLWFFFMFFQFLTIMGSVLGLPMPLIHGYCCREFAAYQMAGATITFAIISFWVMRGHLKDIFKKAFRYNSKIDDSDEPISYKFALIGIIVGLFIMCIWGIFAGVSFWVMFVVVILYFLILIAKSKLVSEGGMFYIQQQFRPLDIIFPIIGSAAIGPAAITMTVFFEHIFIRDIRATLFPFLMDSYKISDSTKLKKRALTLCLVASVIVAIVGSYWAVLKFMYKYGGVNLENWFTISYPSWCTSGRIATILRKPVQPNLINVLHMAIGTVVMLFLMWMRRIFLWWPFHPLGYVMGCSWPMVQLWSSVFIGWLIKVLILKFGGIVTYKKLTPGFLGLIIGEFVTIGFWAFVDFISGVKGHQIWFI